MRMPGWNSAGDMTFYGAAGSRPEFRWFGRGVRAVEGARLERVYTGNRIVGSNPTLSANRRGAPRGSGNERGRFDVRDPEPGPNGFQPSGRAVSLLRTRS